MVIRRDLYASNPGAKRILKLESVDNNSLFGHDVVKGEARRFSVDKVANFEVLN